MSYRAWFLDFILDAVRAGELEPASAFVVLRERALGAQRAYAAAFARD